MEKITIITIGENTFKLTSNADFLISDYLKFLKSRVHNEEQLLDIESQISYIFMSETDGNDIPITEKNVWAAIRVVADNEKIYYKPSAKKQQKYFDNKQREEAKQKKEHKIYNKVKDPKKILAGVCLELAERTGLNLLLIRIAFVGVTLITGWAAAVYFILWIVFEKKSPACKEKRELY